MVWRLDEDRLVQARCEAGRKIEVLNLKQDHVSQLLEEPHFYPAYHMNKKYRISIPLMNE